MTHFEQEFVRRSFNIENLISITDIIILTSKYSSNKLFLKAFYALYDINADDDNE